MMEQGSKCLTSVSQKISSNQAIRLLPPKANPMNLKHLKDDTPQTKSNCAIKQ